MKFSAITGISLLVIIKIL